MNGAYSGGADPSQERKVTFFSHSSRRESIGGLEHHVLEWLPEVPPRATVLLLHGYMDVAASWQEIAGPLVRSGYRVLAPDLRGFGDGPRAAPGSYYYFSDYIADVAALVIELTPEGLLYVVGHSMGGTVASLYAGTYPERVAKLALLEGLGPPDNDFSVAPERMREFVEGSRTHRRASERSMTDIDEAVRRLSLSHPNVDVEILRARAPDLVRPVAGGGVVWRFDPLHRARSPFPFYAGAFRAFASKVACPVLAISGGPAGFHPADEAERLAAFRDAKTVELESAGHMMHWTQPADVAAKLVEFFAS